MIMGPTNDSKASQNDAIELKADKLPQGWETLGKGFEFFFFWLMVLIIIYGFATAVLLYCRNEKPVRQAKDVTDNEGKSVNSPNEQGLREEDLYPVVQLTGDHENHYLGNFKRSTMIAHRVELTTSKRVYTVGEPLSMRTPKEPGKTLNRSGNEEKDMLKD